MADHIHPATHYALGEEGARLGTPGAPTLEALRTRVLLTRHLPDPPAVVLDVGGGTGAYALPLARRGYKVHLVDPYPGHVEAAAQASAAQPRNPLASAQLGDARQLALVEGALADGVHRNLDPVAHPRFFTLAHFHRPEELRQELVAAGFASVDLLAVEGPGSFQDGLDLADQAQRAAVLRAIERVQREPSLLGASSHLMAIGTP